ncbi:hypothetical protein [Demequina sp.]|uniref:hypothetical protein n=1 Tax=Demequina sp. TaxID=2050685 RepID=UPI002600A33E|nr:hypothetical protein [Demequina sp.]
MGVTSASAAVTDDFGVGAPSLAKPASGGRYIYVDDSGRNMVTAAKGSYSDGSPWRNINRVSCLTTGRLPAWVGMVGWSTDQACPEPDITHPLASVEAGVSVARAGDVVVVRSGQYFERVGYHAQRGTASRPIVLQNYPGERVEVHGWLKLVEADYWTVEGLRWIWNRVETQGAQSVVNFIGGTGWTFAHNEVRDSHGVANVLVRAKGGASSSSQRVDYAPHDYSIIGNCIAFNRGTQAGLDHNIYLMPSIWSTGGEITHNLLVSAPYGGNIKAAGSRDPNESPRDVNISYNTLLGGASGMIFGLKARDIAFTRNVVSLSRNSSYYDGGVKTYSMSYPGTIGVKDNVIGTYRFAIRESGWPSEHIYVRRIVNSSAPYTGSVKNCSITFTKSWTQDNYGHHAG